MTARRPCLIPARKADIESDAPHLNSKIRLISHRSFGFHSAQALIALVYLCCTGIVIDLPR